MTDDLKALVESLIFVSQEPVSLERLQAVLEGVPAADIQAAVDGLVAEGRAAHQGPEDGSTSVHLPPELRGRVVPGAMVRARVVSSEGVDLHAVEVSVVRL